MVMKIGPDHFNNTPQVVAAVISHGGVTDENALKQTRRRKECIGT